jgi:hypothetical protein
MFVLMRQKNTNILVLDILAGAIVSRPPFSWPPAPSTLPNARPPENRTCLFPSPFSCSPCRLVTDPPQQDRTPGKTYERVIYFLLAIKAVEVVWGPIYDVLDGRWLGHSLRMPEKQRVAFRKRAIEEKMDLRGWRVERPVLVAVTGILAAWIVVGWVVSRFALAFALPNVAPARGAILGMSGVGFDGDRADFAALHRLCAGHVGRGRQAWRGGSENLAACSVQRAACSVQLATCSMSAAMTMADGIA